MLKKKEQKAISHLYFSHSCITPRTLVCVFFKCAKGGLELYTKKRDNLYTALRNMKEKRAYV